jgi:hypothetical protein
MQVPIIILEEVYILPKSQNTHEIIVTLKVTYLQCSIVMYLLAKVECMIQTIVMQTF